MEQNIINIKALLQDMKDVHYNPEYIKSLEEVIERIEETLCYDTIEDDLPF